jgi:hypothetical protein
MSAIVGNLIEQIRRLTDEEWVEFGEALRQVRQEQWERIRAELNRTAVEKGITEADLDRMFDEARAESRKQWSQAR